MATSEGLQHYNHYQYHVVKTPIMVFPDTTKMQLSSFFLHLSANINEFKARSLYLSRRGLKNRKNKKTAQPYEWQGRISSAPQVSFANISETVTARALKLFDFSQNIFLQIS